MKTKKTQLTKELLCLYYTANSAAHPPGEMRSTSIRLRLEPSDTLRALASDTVYGFKSEGLTSIPVDKTRLRWRVQR